MPLDELTRDLDVLIVDDEATVRELLLEYFTTQGFRVTDEEDGRRAIATIQRAWGRFGLVITDLNLPGADGFAVLQAARQANPNCYVVIITGYASLDSAIRAVRVGAYDYLTKPFSLSQLDVILTRIGDRRGARPSPRPQPAPAPAPIVVPLQDAAPTPIEGRETLAPSRPVAL
ncbi:MAG: response regulator, partial [Pirellulaceae bacterium]